MKGKWVMDVRKSHNNEETYILKLYEDQFLDFKSKNIKPSKLQTHFVAFANSDGGNMYIGIEDIKVDGERINGFKTIEEANDLIRLLLEETRPSVENVELEFIDFFSKGFVLHINISKSPKVHYTSQGKCYIRINASTIEIKGERVTRLSYSKGLFSYENTIIENTELVDIINGLYIKDYLKRIKSSLEPLEFLKKQKLVTKKNNIFYPNASCILLFSDEPQACLSTKCAIKVYRLNTCELEYKREYLSGYPVTIEGPIELQILKSLECVNKYLNDYPNIIDGNYIKFGYPYNVLKEIIVNAIIHRDYSLNDDIHIRIYNNRIEVQSPGGFPGYITEENILREHFSRNVKIVRIMNKLPEKINFDLGEGLITTFQELKKSGFVNPDIKGNSNSVVVIIKNKSLDPINDLVKEKLKLLVVKNNNNNFLKDSVSKMIGNTYTYSKKYVSLSAFLPTYPDIKGSCLITFARITDCMITIDNNFILNSIFIGLYTDISFNLRGFMVAQDSNNKEIYYVQLGNNRVVLLKDELIELCDIIDDLSSHYLSALIKIEKKLETYQFEKSRYMEKGYNLIKINRSLWRMIIEFVNEHDYEKGNTQWHIFDASGNGMIKVFSKESNERYDKGYHVILYPEPIERIYFSSYKYPDEEISIIWKPMMDFQRDEEIENFNIRRFWNAEVTYKWLTNELIPYVLYYFSQSRKKKRLFISKKNLSYDKFMEEFDINRYIGSNKIRKYFDLYSISRVKQLLCLVENMQSFFNANSRRKVFLRSNEVISLYSAVSICLKYTPLDQYEYIKGNLRFAKGETLNDILECIDSYIKTLSDRVLSSFIIDTVLRCLVVTLRDYKSYLEKDQINDIVNYLRPLYEKQILFDSLERFQDRRVYQ